MLKEFFTSFLTSSDPEKVKIRQYALAGTIVFVLLAVLVFLVVWFDEGEVPLAAKAPVAVKEIESSGSRVKPEEQHKKLSEALQSLQTSLETAQKAQQETGKKDAYEQKLESTLQELQEKLSQKSSSAPGDFPPPPSGMGAPGSLPTASPIQKFSLQSWGERELTKTVKNTIPAGAFVRSVLLSGLDASAAMSAADHPRPVLLRMIDTGTLPRKFKSDLKDCHMTAAAHGDLSSERVYARLEKLTCTVRKTGEIIETHVAGYIAGGDGKAGIRGTVVSKDAAFLERSLLGGLFSGLSNIANPQNRQNMVNPFSAGNSKVDAPSARDMFSSGMAQGATNALDRLSQYYISRAEQLQPVIQVAAGQIVDVVFTEGAAFGSHNVKEKIARLRGINPSSSPESSYPALENKSQDTAPPSSPPQTFPSGD